MIEDREYFEAVEEFLSAIQDGKVRAISAVALMDDEETHDYHMTYNCGKYDLMECAAVLQFAATEAHLGGSAARGDPEEEDGEE